MLLDFFTVYYGCIDFSNNGYFSFSGFFALHVYILVKVYTNHEHLELNYEKYT